MLGRAICSRGTTTVDCTPKLGSGMEERKHRIEAREPSRPGPRLEYGENRQQLRPQPVS